MTPPPVVSAQNFDYFLTAHFYNAHLGPARNVWVLFLLVSEKIIKRHPEIVGYLLELICFGNASAPFPVA